MFVQTNSLAAIKEYFTERLNETFSSSELKSMFNQLAEKRLQCSRSELLLDRDRRLSESDLLYFRSVVKRLLQKEPFQYIIGQTEFYGLAIQVDDRVLIPRPETEELVQWVIDTSGHQRPTKFVDVCTGSGCIALALKNHFSDATVIATDYSTEALMVAKANAVQNELDIIFHSHDALTFLESDFLPVMKSDVWVSNPPYIPINEKQRMAEHVVDFEPHMALFVSDSDPLCFYNAIAQAALRHLNTGGWLFVEIHEDLSEQVTHLFSTLGLVAVEVKKDLQGKNRMVKGMKSS